jgi:hypothetical protein
MYRVGIQNSASSAKQFFLLPTLLFAFFGTFPCHTVSSLCDQIIAHEARFSWYWTLLSTYRVLSCPGFSGLVKVSLSCQTGPPIPGLSVLHAPVPVEAALGRNQKPGALPPSLTGLPSLFLKATWAVSWSTQSGYKMGCIRSHKTDPLAAVQTFPGWLRRRMSHGSPFWVGGEGQWGRCLALCGHTQSGPPAQVCLTFSPVLFPAQARREHGHEGGIREEEIASVSFQYLPVTTWKLSVVM